MIGIEGPGEDLTKNFEDISSKFPRVMFTPEEKDASSKGKLDYPTAYVFSLTSIRSATPSDPDASVCSLPRGSSHTKVPKKQVSPLYDHL